MNKTLRERLTEETRLLLLNPPTPENFNSDISDYIDYLEDIILDHIDELVELNNECPECKAGAKQCPVWMCGGHLRCEDSEFSSKDMDKFGDEINWQVPKMICNDCNTVWNPKV